MKYSNGPGKNSDTDELKLQWPRCCSCPTGLSPGTPPLPIRLQMMLTVQQDHLILSPHFLQCSSNLHIWITDKCARKLKYEYMHFLYFESINLLFILMEKNIGLLQKTGIKGQKKEKRTEEWEIEIK